MFSKLYTKNKSLQGWNWFDWANQAYALSALVVILPVMIPQIFNSLTGGETKLFGLTLTGTSFYAFLIGFGSILVAIICPIFGVIADNTWRAKRGMEALNVNFHGGETKGLESKQIKAELISCSELFNTFSS